jgi:competence protein ComEC
MLIGMVRVGIVIMEQPAIIIDEDKVIYEGLIIETSVNTKIIRLSKPENMDGVKAIFRAADNLNINDKIRIFGQAKELNLTFKNPYLTTWKWLKRLEGVSYEVRGTLISVAPGKNLVHAWRNRLKERIEISGAKYTSVIKALTIGDTTGLDEDTKTLFLRTGTSHILAISGSNIGIVTAFFFFIARFLIRRVSVLRHRGDDIKYAALITIPFAFMFMLIAGSGIPIIRATIMITVYMFSLFFERGRNIINTIALSALIILLIYPHSLFTPSFQLTFMSVLFIVIFTEKFFSLIRIVNKMAKWFLFSILTTISATLGTLPIVIYHFYGINPFSVIHNIIAIPLMCILAMPMSLIGMVLPYGEYILRLAGEILNINMQILKYLNAGYIYPIIRPTLFEIILYFAFAFALIFSRRKLILALLIFVIMPVSTIHVYLAYEKRFNNNMRINFMDVGIGDSILIEAPKGMRILIDGGGHYKGDYDTGKSILTPILLSKKILTLDYVINTHPHGDHIGGLPYILQNFNVKQFVASTYFIKEEKFIEIMKLIRDKGIPVQTWKRGDNYTFKNNMQMLVLNPEPNFSLENLNNASIVLKVIYKNNTFLLTGDIEKDIEERLILSGTPLKSNVLKIPHHGSKNSNSFAFIRSVKPDIAILSGGPGIKGLPSEEALQRYKEFSIPLLRTDKNGFIQICSDGNGISYKVFQK